MSALSSVVLPDPVPPDTRMLCRPVSARRAASSTSRGMEPEATRSSAENARLPNRRMVMATDGEAGGTQMATRDPSSRRASTTGIRAGSSPEGPCDLERGAGERRSGQRGRFDLRHLAFRVRSRQYRAG